MPKAVTAVTVSTFFDKYGDKLKAELIAGSEGLHRQIREPSINRPALALTGFYKYFANKRVQVIGSAITGTVVPQDFWRAEAPGAPSGDFLLAEIPADAVPETVLARLGSLS